MPQDPYRQGGGGRDRYLCHASQIHAVTGCAHQDTPISLPHTVEWALEAVGRLQAKRGSEETEINCGSLLPNKSSLAKPDDEQTQKHRRLKTNTWKDHV